MKTKRGGRELNPTDAFRKQARKRENKRNKAERTYIRDAFGKAQNTDKLSELKAELEELIAEEQQSGELNRLQKLRKKVVLEAYEVAIRKKKEEELKKRQEAEEGTQQHAGLSSVPLPKPPPLPAGPKPGLPPPPGLPPLPAGPLPGAYAGLLPPPPMPPPSLEAVAAAAAASSVPVLPPPPGPPPPSTMLPPPLGPPPMGMLPPPPGPPPGAGMAPPPGMLPPPGGSILPPGPHGASSSSSILPPPTSGPPASKAAAAAAAAAAGGGGGGGAPTITGASTVAKRPLAHQDKALTSMVPASVLVKREAAAKAAAAAAAGGAAVEELRIGPGFGLAPVQRRPAAGPGGRPQQKQQPLAPPPQLGRWGNAVTVTSLPQGSKAGGARGPGSSAAAGASSTAAKVDEKLVDFMSSLAELGAFD